MITYTNRNQSFIESDSPHSIGLANNVTIPNPGWDSNPLLLAEKQFQGRTASNGFSGLGNLTFDGTGLLGTGLFSGEWGVMEWATLFLVGYGLILLTSPKIPEGKRRLVKRYVGDKGYWE